MISFRKWIFAVPAALLLGGTGLVLGDPPMTGDVCPARGGIMQASCCEGGSCQSGWCQHIFCGPCHHHCSEGPPRIWFKCGCPRPICEPGCETPNWGYHQPCWNPWPWPPDWSHCPVPPPASHFPPGNHMLLPGQEVITPVPMNPNQLPPPKKI
jgi:hypothetical protein